METFCFGILGGVIPSVVIVIGFFITISGRLARIETNIIWLIKEIKECQPL